MDDYSEFSGIDQKVRAAYRTIYPNPAFATKLKREIVTHSRPNDRRWQPIPRTSRLVMLGGAFFLALVLIVVGFTQPLLVQAVRQLFSYIPGMGVIDGSSSIRAIAQPVSQTREGRIVTIEQVVVDSVKTVVQFKVAGISPSDYALPASLSTCWDTPFLLLPDGTKLERTGYNAFSHGDGAPEYETSISLAPVPADVQDGVLVMPCILGLTSRPASEKWEFPLHFIPAPDDLLKIQVTDLRTTQPLLPDPTLLSAVAPMPAEGAAATGGITLSLDRIVQLPDSYLLYGNLQWTESVPYSAVTLDSYQLKDAHGQVIPIRQISPDPAFMPVPGSRKTPIGFEIMATSQIAYPVTLSVQSVDVSMPVKNTEFVIDTGTNPQVGQQWITNQDIQVEGRTIHFDTMQRTTDGYEFGFQAPDDILCVDLMLQGAHATQGQCGSSYTKIGYEGNVPTGLVSVTIPSIEFMLTGNWQATWTR